MLWYIVLLISLHLWLIQKVFASWLLSSLQKFWFFFLCKRSSCLSLFYFLQLFSGNLEPCTKWLCKCLVNINLLYIFELGNMTALLLSKVSLHLSLKIRCLLIESELFYIRSRAMTGFDCVWGEGMRLLVKAFNQGFVFCSWSEIFLSDGNHFSYCTNKEQINKDLCKNRLCCLLLVFHCFFFIFCGKYLSAARAPAMIKDMSVNIHQVTSLCFN